MASNAIFRTDESAGQALAAVILEMSRQPVLVLDETLVVRRANDACRALLGREHPDLEGRCILDLVDGTRDQPRLRHGLEQLVERRRPIDGLELQSRPGKGGRPILLNARAVPDQNRRAATIVMTLEETAPDGAGLSSADEKGASQKIFDAVKEPLLVLCTDLRVRSANAAFYELFRRDPMTTEGRGLFELDDGAWDTPEVRGLFRQVLADEGSSQDVLIEQKVPDCGRRTLCFDARRIDDLKLILLTIQDVTERQRRDREQRLMLAELNHRVKNLFAVVQSLLAMGQAHRTAEDYREVFEGRLQALARAHELLFHEGSLGADLATLIERLVTPHTGGRAGALEIAGPPVTLTPRQVMSLGLVLHELTTNALKYGALSGANGKVRVRWDVERSAADGDVSFLWQERGGPPVGEPREQGFGTRLVEKAFSFELNGAAHLVFEPSGFRLEARFPLG